MLRRLRRQDIDPHQRLHKALLDAKIQHVYYESPGTDHEWQTWRRDLKDFASRLFAH